MEQRAAAGGAGQPSVAAPLRVTDLGGFKPAKVTPPALTLPELPHIVEILSTGSDGKLVVLRYADFVKFSGRTVPVTAPDVVAVLDHGDEHAFVVLALAEYQSYCRKLRFAGSIDEPHYLAKYPDIAAVVKRRQLISGTEHYIVQGHFERREVRF